MNGDSPSRTTPAAVGRRARPEAGRWQWGLGLFLPLLIVWVALNGTDAWWLGPIAAAAGAAVGAWLAPGDPHPWRLARLPRFAGFFLWQSLVGGLDVARRALDPRLPVAPCFVDHPMWLPPGQPRTLMVSVVCLMPGSLSVDVDLCDNVLNVHLLVPRGSRTLDALEAEVGRLFGLTRENA